jgi:hypothetical protein
VFDDLLEYIDEKTAYSWKVGDDGEYIGKGEIENKSDFHYMDAERYILSDFRPDMAVQSTGPKVFRWRGKGYGRYKDSPNKSKAKGNRFN